jgi:hypothetical protein
VLNSLAAQEFGSDYTDPYLVRTVGASVTFPTYRAFDFRLEGTYEHDSPLGIHADPVRGDFEPTVDFRDVHAARASLVANRPLLPWFGKTDLSLRAEVRTRFPFAPGATDSAWRNGAVRGSLLASLERPVGESMRLVTSAMVAGVHIPTGTDVPATELIYLGGPVSAPGYAYHSAVATFGYYGHVEFRVPAPFPSFSLGRYGRVPGRGAFAPYVHFAGVDGGPGRCRLLEAGGSVCVVAPRTLPAFGAGYLTPFDLLRIDVARGVGRNGRWMFSIDVTRDFWSIL